MKRSRRLSSISALVILAIVLPACSSASGGVELAPPVLPGKADFSTPQAAVRTYVEYTDYAYRMANSDIASPAATPYEGVRVDSYIQLNREKDRGIEQRLVSFTERSVSKEGTRTLLAASEEWRYRYFSLTGREYTSPVYTASYDTTYTLVRDKKGWLVDKVDARALTPVK
ncbi:MAG TPA: hypothetical protein VGK50_03720 [Coriobacteriia bacterium]|jgi:hypothetical protein